ncbi:MAG TPA: HAD family hydrolase [Actinomycetaceae bacterium]|nr:HAD family hydrolase [Actinomycetaceae bacterium]
MSTSTPATCERPPGHAEVVVWDFGNVLVRWDPAEAVADRWSRTEFADLAARANFVLLNDRMDSGLPNEELVEELHARDPEAAEMWRHYVANVPASLFRDIAGTAELVDELADAGVPQYGLTNWGAAIAPGIRELVPGARRLQGAVVSGLVGHVKPGREIFGVLIERFGLDPSRTLFIDDRDENTAVAGELGFLTHTFDTPGGAGELRTHMARLGLPVAATDPARD